MILFKVMTSCSHYGWQVRNFNNTPQKWFWPPTVFHRQILSPAVHPMWFQALRTQRWVRSHITAVVPHTWGDGPVICQQSPGLRKIRWEGLWGTVLCLLWRNRNCCPCRRRKGALQVEGQEGRIAQKQDINACGPTLGARVVDVYYEGQQEGFALDSAGDVDMSLQWLEGSPQCPSPISTCSVEGEQVSPLINTAIRSFQPPKLVHGEITAGALKCCPVSQAGLTGGCWGGGKRSASAGAGSCTVHWLEPPVEWFELDPMCILDTLPKTALRLLICPFHGWTLPESRVQQAQCFKLYVHVSRDEGWLKQPHTITCYKNCYCPECWKRSISLSPLSFSTTQSHALVVVHVNTLCALTMPLEGLPHVV